MWTDTFVLAIDKTRFMRNWTDKTEHLHVYAGTRYIKHSRRVAITSEIELNGKVEIKVQ